MGGAALGPVVLSAERAAVLAGFLILVIFAGLLSRRRGERINRWATGAALATFLGARAGFVLMHFDVFRSDPLSVLAVWQGGFSLVGGTIGFVLASLWFMRRDRVLIVPALILSFAGSAVGTAIWLLLAGEGAALPDHVRLVELDGSPVRPAEWHGRPVVINLWASWCPPCRREMPMMAEIAAAGTGVELIFVNQGENAATIRRYLSQEDLLIHPILDPGHQLMQHFNAMGLPATLFIDAEGRLAFAYMGEISHAQLLAGMNRLRPALP